MSLLGSREILRSSRLRGPTCLAEWQSRTRAKSVGRLSRGARPDTLPARETANDRVRSHNFAVTLMRIRQSFWSSVLPSEIKTIIPSKLRLGARASILATVLVLGQPCVAAPFQFEETGSLATARWFHTATLLPNGKVLVAGGWDASDALASAELYDPASGTWTDTGSLATSRGNPTATLLPNGKVLVAGGYNDTFGALASAELYDPASGTWTATGSLLTARYVHTATLLPNGQVLVAGGSGIGGALASAELYDPGSGTWTATGSLAIAREYYTTTLLPDGKVLAAGGFNNTGFDLSSAELYDLSTGTWTATGSMATARESYTAMLLPNGKVLVAGGYNGVDLASAELYDPISGTWTATGSLNAPRSVYTAILLPNGEVLAVGGGDNSGFLSTELYDPASGTWTVSDSLNVARVQHTATLLPNGRLLVAGGVDFINVLASAELYDVGLGFSSLWKPDIATARLGSGHRVRLTGSLFQGISQASSGNSQDSSSNYPVVQLRSLANSEVVFLLADPTGGWSDRSFVSQPVRDFPSGPALVTVFTNGIPSTAEYLRVSDTP
jgi:WD40 repeat protein